MHPGMIYSINSIVHICRIALTLIFSIRFCYSFTKTKLSAGRKVKLIATSALRGRRSPPSFLPDGFSVRDDLSTTLAQEKVKKPISVTSVEQLKELIYQGVRVRDMDVRGDSKVRTDSSELHPVVKALYERKEKSASSGAGRESDGRKIGLAIEGGGMRGCVSAGMATAVWYLGLQDSIDVVYGSSAGSLVGAYFITGQLPHFGPEIYYDVLTTAGKEFIDVRAILRSCGLGLLDLRLRSLLGLFSDRMGSPVLSLKYLLETVVQTIKPLDWATFWEKQASEKQVLKVVASGLLSRRAVLMSARDGNFRSVQELGECMKASMLLPGVTGNPIRLKGEQATGDNIEKTYWREYESLRWGKGELVKAGEPMADSQLFEPIPYRSAIRENCTHVLVLRTRADGVSVTSKMGMLEKLITKRFFGRKLKLPEIESWMNNQMHKLVYAEDVLRLNAANRDMTDKVDAVSGQAKLFCVALPEGVPEVKRFESSRKVIFESVREGFAAAYDALVKDPQQRGRGMEVAREIWPDSILLQKPAHIN